MIKVTFLEGIAGLRLKDNKALEIKKGINLIVGKNGSGKTNLSHFIQFLLSGMGPLTGQRVFETSFLNEQKDKILERHKRRSKHLEGINDDDLLDSVFCRYGINNGVKGELRLSLEQTGTLPKETFEGNFSNLVFDSGQIKVKRTHDSNHTVFEIAPNINLSEEGIVINKEFNLFRSSSSGQGNPIVTAVVSAFNGYFKDAWEKFVESDEGIKKQLEQLEKEIFKQYSNFFGTTGKKIELTLDPNKYDSRALVLKVGNNEIGFERFSSGEKNLFNMIIRLAIVKVSAPGLLILDEPDLFMHDDMTKVLAQELKVLTETIPDTVILVVTHSSSFIEELARYKDANLIVIDNEKRAFNSKDDIDFINVLRDNGVSFSPLYISKRPNIFIENIGDTGEEYRKLYNQFFSSSNQPNVIPIGSNGQVKGYTNYLKIIENVLETQVEHKTLGLIDGDIWFSNQLKKYLPDEKNFPSNLISELKSQNGFYIKSDHQEMIYFFNCWEIENLYLLEELLPYWKNDSSPLTIHMYKEILEKEKETICNNWLKTYDKSVFTPIYWREGSDYEGKLEKALKEIKIHKEQKEKIKVQMNSLFDSMLSNNMYNWMPGKELLSVVKKTYEFKPDIDLSEMIVAKKIRKIIEN